MDHHDDDLRRALDALDARQVPAAASDWEERVLETLQRAPRAPRARRPLRRARLRLLLAACLALAALLVFFGSGAAAKVGIPNPIDFRAGWSEVPDNGQFDNAFRIQWEMFLRHVVEDAPWEWDLLEGAKGVQLAELALQSSRERRWIDVPELTLERA